MPATTSRRANRYRSNVDASALARAFDCHGNRKEKPKSQARARPHPRNRMSTGVPYSTAFAIADSGILSHS